MVAKPERSGNNNLFVVGVTGLLFEDHSQKEILSIYDMLDQSISHADNIVVCSKFINKGTSKIAYDWAFARSIPTMGIAPKVCWEFPCRLVTSKEVIPGDWGDEIDLFTNVCDGLINFWKTEHTEVTMALMTKKNKRVLDLSEHLSKVAC